MRYKRGFKKIYAMGQNQSKKQKGEKAEGSYNGWMFARDFSKGVFALINNGKIFPAFGLLLLGLIGLILWRLPENDLAPLVRDSLFTLRSSVGTWLTLFFMSNVVWLWLHIRQRRLYRREIDRLTELRSVLMHQQDRHLQITNHRSSQNVNHQTHIIPQPKQKGSK